MEVHVEWFGPETGNIAAELELELEQHLEPMLKGFRDMKFTLTCEINDTGKVSIIGQ